VARVPHSHRFAGPINLVSAFTLPARLFEAPLLPDPGSSIQAAGFPIFVTIAISTLQSKGDSSRGDPKEPKDSISPGGQRCPDCGDIHPNGEAGPAINLGFEHATGELMSYLNPDGMLLPGSIPYVARYFERHPDVDVVYGHVVLLDEEDFEVGRWVLPRHDDKVLSWGDHVPAEGLFWRRAAWEAVGGAVDEDFRAALDWELVLCFREAGARIVRVPRFLSGLRVKVDRGASAANGSDEASRLRHRVHGREVSSKEVEKAVRGYRRRHALLQGLYRLRVLRY
jgi:Glycosyl transferase family 2